MPAATAAAAPPDDPPGVRVGSSGLRAIGPIRGSDASDSPNSGMVVTPNGLSPARLKRLARSESSVEAGASASAAAPQRTASPAAAEPRSFMRKGRPGNGIAVARRDPASSSRSIACARSRAGSASVRQIAPRSAQAAARSSEASRAAAAVVARDRMAAAISLASAAVASRVTSFSHACPERPLPPASVAGVRSVRSCR